MTEHCLCSALALNLKRLVKHLKHRDISPDCLPHIALLFHLKEDLAKSQILSHCSILSTRPFSNALIHMHISSIDNQVLRAYRTGSIIKCSGSPFL